jgi:hypothetical protein
MSLAELAELGSFVSGLAIVFSFVFLALQMRQANLNQRSLMQQGRGARTVDSIWRMADPYISGLLVRSYKADGDLNSSEVNSLFNALGLWFWDWEDGFLQVQAGKLDQVSWESDLKALKQACTEPSYRVAWRLQRPYMGGAFRDYVDNLMRATKAEPPPDLAALWKAWMAEERAAM